MAVSADTVSDTQPMWGIRVAIDANIPGKWRGNGRSIKMYKPGAGIVVGGVYNVYMGRNLYFEPGLSAFYDTYSYDDLTVLGNDGVVDSDPSVYKLGVRVPLTVGYVFSIGGNVDMSVFTGPELSYAFGGKVKVGDKELLQNIDTTLFGADGQRRFDCAWKVGVGVPVNAFTVSVEAAFGLTDMLRTPMSYKEYRVSVGVTYYM